MRLQKLSKQGGNLIQKKKYSEYVKNAIKSKKQELLVITYYSLYRKRSLK